MRRVTIYTDYKSPYAYLAKDLAYELERDRQVQLEWLPYVLDIPSFLGSARVGTDGTVLEEDRSAHQWRRVRYSYMDCRRQARKRGLVIRGPQKIWDSTLAAAGMLFFARRTSMPACPPPSLQHDDTCIKDSTCAARPSGSSMPPTATTSATSLPAGPCPDRAWTSSIPSCS